MSTTRSKTDEWIPHVGQQSVRPGYYLKNTTERMYVKIPKLHMIAGKKPVEITIKLYLHYKDRPDDYCYEPCFWLSDNTKANEVKRTIYGNDLNVYDISNLIRFARGFSSTRNKIHMVSLELTARINETLVATVKSAQFKVAHYNTNDNFVKNAANSVKKLAFQYHNMTATQKRAFKAITDYSAAVYEDKKMIFEDIETIYSQLVPATLMEEDGEEST